MPETIPRTKDETVADVLAALDTAIYEMVTLIPRVTPTYARNLEGAVQKAKAALRAYEEAV